jgi:iron complex transport system substrate-binding protein
VRGALTMRGWHALARLTLPLLLAGCGTAPESVPNGAAARAADGAPATAAALGGTAVPVRYARTFTATDVGPVRVVDLRAAIITWGGSAKGPEQHARLVLVPHGATVPPLTGPLAGATVVRTPVRRVGVNVAPLEAMLTALGTADRLVAVGGPKSYDDAVRARTLRGELAQVGYGWHAPPEIDALVAARPDVFLMSMGDLGHAPHMRRIASLGIPVVPVFLDAEPDYMGKVEYIRLVGMLTGREAEADAYLARVAASVDSLKRAAAAQPTRTVVSAWFAGGDRWMATIRNADAKLLRDANGLNPLEAPDDARQDAFTRIGTEQMLARARDAECWILRDTHSRPFTDVRTLRQFRAYREGCLFASDGMAKPAADAWDLYETAVIRPDLVLGDLVRMLHPALRTGPGAAGPFRYVRPDTAVAR